MQSNLLYTIHVDLLSVYGCRIQTMSYKNSDISKQSLILYYIYYYVEVCFFPVFWFIIFILWMLLGLFRWWLIFKPQQHNQMCRLMDENYTETQDSRLQTMERSSKSQRFFVSLILYTPIGILIDHHTSNCLQ